VQSKLAVNISSFEKAEFIDKNGQIDKDLTFAGEKNLLRGLVDINQFNRHSVDAKTEVPALVRPFTHPDWNKDLGERILWMNNRSIPAAEIKLNPQHLGPISVRIDVNQDQATISFAAQHSTVREALEASIPRLRDMLSAQQLNVVDVNVSQHFSSDQGRSQPQNFAQTASSSTIENSDFSTEALEEIDNGRAIITKGLLSIYA
jgi:flagellar hook-length control protein FliK